MHERFGFTEHVDLDAEGAQPTAEAEVGVVELADGVVDDGGDASDPEGAKVGV